MTNPLGKKIASPDKFSPNILFPISRADQRQGMTRLWSALEIGKSIFGENLSGLAIFFPSGLVTI